MYRKLLFTLIVMIGMASSAACTPEPASPPPAAAMPNPASVYCEQSSGKLELRQDASGGVLGICVFADGSTCDEWTYFRGECQPGNSLVTSSPVATPAPGPRPSNAEPAVSPSPTPKPGVLRVAYFGAGYVRLWAEGADSRPLAKADNIEQVRISDDGQVAAYLSLNSRGLSELFAVNADGSNQHSLVGLDYLQTIQPADKIVYFGFAPSSHTLYFVTDQYDLHRVNAANGSPASIFEAGKGGFFSFSPDGRWMALYHPNELVLAHLDGTEARVVFQYPEDFRYTLMGPEIVWKPDGSGFFMISASGPQGNPDNMAVWSIPVVGEPIKQMSYGGPYGANLSPDGRNVVYLYYQHEPVDVHVVAADGKDISYGSYAKVSFMGWAPDSKHFLLNLSPDGRLNEPFLCAVGEEPVKLTDTDDALPVDWIDVQQVLFASHGKALRLQRLGAPSSLVDADASSWFDYAYIRP
jgi:putative hemolysin